MIVTDGIDAPKLITLNEVSYEIHVPRGVLSFLMRLGELSPDFVTQQAYLFRAERVPELREKFGRLREWS